jgi:hypothetical protein
LSLQLHEAEQEKDQNEVVEDPEELPDTDAQLDTREKDDTEEEAQL